MAGTGVLIVGAMGHIAATVVVGASALKLSETPRIGMVTDLGDFAGLGLPEPGEMVFGGWDIRSRNLGDAARDILRKSALPDEGDAVSRIGNALERYSANIFLGTAANCGEAIRSLADGEREKACDSLEDLAGQMREDIRKFKNDNNLGSVVVVNLASTEPPLRLQVCHEDPDAFEECLRRNDTGAIRASTLYAYAAVREKCPYINFTPSNAAMIPAIVRLAEQEGAPVMGNDGKTGETLIKSVLAPMFRSRNLEVMSWEGFNILGNMDGKVLDNPENRESKIRTKDRLLGEVLGYAPHSKVHINHVPSLGDQKTAWDFIHFRGFLGAAMSLQFTWQGYDSMLAAPLVLDLVRMAELGRRRGESGLMPHLACFFKEPLGVSEYAFPEQFGMLRRYAERASEEAKQGA